MQSKRFIVFNFVAIFFFGLVLVFSAAIDAGAVTVDIYATQSGTELGTPYSNIVGSFTSSDIMFATSTGYDWHPYNLGSFGADINGVINVSADGAYSFSLNSDDGSGLFIDGNQVIDNGGAHGPNIIFGTANLTAGTHAINVKFFEDHGGASGVDLTLPTGVSYTPLPSTLLIFAPGLLGLIAVRRRINKVH
jgi:hypothetical protein